MERHDTPETLTPPISDTERAMMEERMKLFIFPNEAASAEQIEAFDLAVEYQIVHERVQAAALGDVPNGVSSFKIGDFSMSFADGATSSKLTRKTLCEAAYSVLLRAGLLYRGLPRMVGS